MGVAPKLYFLHLPKHSINIKDFQATILTEDWPWLKKASLPVTFPQHKFSLTFVYSSSASDIYFHQVSNHYFEQLKETGVNYN